MSISSNLHILGLNGPFEFCFWSFLFGVCIFVCRVCVFLAIS